jgi:hypothetical protein
METAIITLDEGPIDEEIRSKYGLPELRRQKILRITNEAYDQGVLLTQEDLAYKILNCTPRTIRRDIDLLKKRGLHVPTRGEQKDIGRGTCHRVKAVELFIQRWPETKIARELRHSLDAIKQYILTFSRVAFLSKRGYKCKDISFLVQISDTLTEKYLALLKQYDQTEYDERLKEIVKLAEPYEKKRI